MAINLHGTLLVWIKEATDLPGLAASMCCWQNGKDRDNPVGPFVTVEISEARVLRSAVVHNSTHPVWDEHFIAEAAYETNEIVFKVYDDFNLGKLPLGVAKIDAAIVIESKVVEGWYPLEGVAAQAEGSQIFIRIEYIPVRETARNKMVSRAYFDMTATNCVTLYQDAHSLNGELFNKIVLANNSRYVPSTLWRDVEDVLKNAKKFIYLTDWSFAHEIRLTRQTAGSETIGDILKQRAEEGVTVLLMIWKSRFSNELIDLGQHDVKTEKYFSGTKVVVERVLRVKSAASDLDNEIVESIFSHHQKTIIADTVIAGTNQRSIVAFVGGFDITKGRWDSHEHPLFVNGRQEYADDFFQDSAEVDESYGPRLPWHDVHCRIVGPAARDVMKNFEERWTKQVSQRANLLCDINTKEFFLDKPAQIPDSELWQVQLLRSINIDSAAFDPARMERLTSKRGRKTDNSVCRGNILLIRKAEKFIYVENQYFCGSSFAWLEGKTEKCRHVIPMEIVNKIGEKIRANQPFAVYIVIPMRPNGKPDNQSVRDTLLNQRLTIQMMYKKLAGIIKSAGSIAQPTDYLNFYFLGKREPNNDNSSSSEDWALGNKAKLKKTRRFMIYVHSKMMIVDDSYVIVGSANLNQRSMGGNRDTEIAMMGFQSSHVYDGANFPKGAIHGFRMGLWAEHAGLISDEFYDPSSMECVRKVNALAESNLQKYCQDQACSLDGHLIKYPIDINANGDVTHRKGLATFPDSDVAVFGNKRHALPLKFNT